jgi:hypothetical protein
MSAYKSPATCSEIPSNFLLNHLNYLVSKHIIEHLIECKQFSEMTGPCGTKILISENMWNFFIIIIPTVSKNAILGYSLHIKPFMTALLVLCGNSYIKFTTQASSFG